MGLSPSKRIQRTLTNSPEFNSACDSVYTDCLSSAQHAFPGVKPYQLLAATEHLHRTLSNSLPVMHIFIHRWAPQPPDRAQVDRALKALIRCRRSVPAAAGEEEVLLDESMFKDFAVEVFANAAISSAGKEIVKHVPLGAVMIAGMSHFGVLVMPGKRSIAIHFGAYMAAFAISVYLELTG